MYLSHQLVSPIHNRTQWTLDSQLWPSPHLMFIRPLRINSISSYQTQWSWILFGLLILINKTQDPIHTQHVPSVTESSSFKVWRVLSFLSCSHPTANSVFRLVEIFKPCIIRSTTIKSAIKLFFSLFAKFQTRRLFPYPNITHLAPSHQRIYSRIGFTLNLTFYWKKNKL